MKWLKVLGISLGVVALVTGMAWILRTDPIGPVSGRRLSGPEVPYPSDWRFSNDHPTIAVEVRPDDPHSVTTVCFVLDGTLYVPANSGSEKEWTHYVLEDPRVRLKIGDSVYPARAVRVIDFDSDAFLNVAKEKYPQMAERLKGPLPDDIWIFRIEPRIAD